MIARPKGTVLRNAPALTLTHIAHNIHPVPRRLVHEGHLPAKLTEAILCSPNNALLEGLVTNIFVIKGVYVPLSAEAGIYVPFMCSVTKLLNLLLVPSSLCSNHPAMLMSCSAAPHL